MDHLPDRLVQRCGVVDRRERREANGHPLEDGLAGIGTRDEDAQERRHGSVARWDCVEHVAQGRPAGPPELVGVGVDHPVGAEVGRGQTRHARDPLVLAKILTRLADQVEMAIARVLLEDVRRAVDRPIVGRDDEVDAGVEVEREPRVDEVGFVPRQERHDQLHRGASLRRRVRRLARTASRARKPAALERFEPILERVDAPLARTTPSISTSVDASAANAAASETSGAGNDSGLESPGAGTSKAPSRREGAGARRAVAYRLRACRPRFRRAAPRRPRHASRRSRSSVARRRARSKRIWWRGGS